MNNEDICNITVSGNHCDNKDELQLHNNHEKGGVDNHGNESSII